MHVNSKKVNVSIIMCVCGGFFSSYFSLRSFHFSFIHRICNRQNKTYELDLQHNNFKNTLNYRRTSRNYEQTHTHTVSMYW